MSLSLCGKRRENAEERTLPRSGKSARRCDPVDDKENEELGQKEAPMTSSQAKRLKRSIPQQQQSTTSMLSQSIQHEIYCCGRIQKIVLVNFMCHSHYCVELHPRVNFIVGSNGSGKSAILAALVIGMGARARNTNRSDSLRNLIKVGENAARIEITIWNDGPEAFSPELYGDKITIVRNINKSGSSSYKVKDSAGHVVSDKYTDLERILEMHNIQVINPAFVMNQDNAREFLKDMEPKKNYALFMKATLLDAIQEKLYKCQYEYVDQKQRLDIMQKKLNRDKQLISELESKHRRILSYVKMKHEIHQKEIEYDWSLVMEAENELHSLEEDFNAVQKEHEKLTSRTQRKNEMESEQTEAINECKTKIANGKAEYSAENQQCQYIENELKSKVKRYHEIQSEIDVCKKRLARFETQISDLQKYIEDSSNRQGVAEQRRKNESELLSLQNNLQEMKAIAASAGRDLEIFIDDKAQKEYAANSIRNQMQNLTQTIGNCKNEISNLQLNKRNKLSIYGEQVQQILKEIQQTRSKFSKMPIGPIGQFIEVPDAKYRNIVENQIRSILRGFIVDNSKDRAQLNNILRKYPNEHLTVITTKFTNKVHDVRSGCVRPPAGTRLLFDVIRCAEPVVMNCLIDQLRIETILITDDKGIAERVTMRKENVPKNLLKVIVLEPGLEYYPDPNYRMYSLKVQQARCIQVNVDARISQLKTELLKTENEKAKLLENLNECEGEIREATHRLSEKNTALQKHKERCLTIEQRIAELNSFEYPVTNEFDICQKELEDYERQLKVYNQKLAEKQRDFGVAESEKQMAESNLQRHRSRLKAIQQEIQNNENSQNELQMRLRSMLDYSQKSEEKMKRVENRLKEFKEELKRKSENVRDLTQKAQKSGPRKEINRSSDEIFEDIRTRKAQIKQGGKLNEDPAHLQNDIDVKRHILEADISTYNISVVYVQELSHSLKKRLKFMRHFKRHMITLLQHAFSTVLSKRSFTGTIEANHEEQTLEISVIPRDKHINDAVSNTRSLSGGERSYSTVAFLISLWACVDHPFFFLDEYDVFADEVIREYMTRLLMNEGEKRPNRQFVLLTPQDMSIEAQDYMRIHRLAAPLRG